jgi:replication-associated recombination protein RarA
VDDGPTSSFEPNVLPAFEISVQRVWLTVRVFTLSSHTPDALQQILTNALSSLPSPIPHLPPDLIPFLAEVADGDARQALNGLELALKVCDQPRQTTLQTSSELASPIFEEDTKKKRDAELMEAVRRGLRKGYDRSGEERYDMISALHKSLRGSDGSAAMYWLARWVVGTYYDLVLLLRHTPRPAPPSFHSTTRMQSRSGRRMEYTLTRMTVTCSVYRALTEYQNAHRR